MTTTVRYNKETMAIETVAVEGGNGDNGDNGDAQKWWPVPVDIVATLLRYAREDKLDLGDPSDTKRTRAAAQGRARNLYLDAAVRAFIAQRDTKAKAEAEAKAKAGVEAKAEVKSEAEPKAEVKPAVQSPPIAKPQGDGKAKMQGVPKQTQLVR